MAKKVFTDESLKTLIDETKTYIDSSIQTPDWNQNNESAKDYIKNRPFGMVTVENEIINTNLNFTAVEYLDNIYFTEDFTSVQLTKGMTYNVYWNGEQYSCVALDGGEDYVYIGNYHMSPDWEVAETIESNEPFFIVTNSDFSHSLASTSSNTPVTLQVMEMVEAVKQIDEKFLPDNIATEEYVDSGLENKISSANPTGTGSLSLNRKSSTTVGTNSVAVGTDTTASAASSFAEGQNTTASGANSHAEGIQSSATAYAAHAEGAGTTASGVNSHAEGDETFASGESSHAEGLGTIAAGDYQHTQGKYNISDESYAHIVGNGTGIYTPSNAHTLDWEGNANFAGDVYVGNANSNKAGKKLATEEYVDNTINELDAIIATDENSDGNIVLRQYIPEEGIVQVDKTLAIEGAAADAKAVGDKFAKLPEMYAPAGYGYGEPAIAAGNLADETALETSLNLIAATMKNMESKRIYFNVDTIGSYSLYGTLTKHSDNFLTLEATVFATGWKIVKIKYSGTWQPLEWENPPMLLTEEYRTTQRWNGAVVYTKLIDCGYLASVSTGAKDVAHRASIASVVNITGTLSTGDLLPYYNTGTEIQLSCTPSNIKLMSKAWGFEATTPITSIQAVVQIWYIKP